MSHTIRGEKYSFLTIFYRIESIWNYIYSLNNSENIRNGN